MKIKTDNSDVPIAIVGMACRLPGAENLDEYWNLISQGLSAVDEVPSERLNREVYYDPKKGTRGKTYSTKAALLKDRNFNRDRCPLPDDLVSQVDNTHLLMTEVASESLRHAGYDPFNLPNRNASVFIGHAQGSSLLGDLSFQAYLDDAIAMLVETPGFTDLPADQQLQVQQELLDNLRKEIPSAKSRTRFLNCNMVSGTIAKAFGLSGSWLALNSACSSSLLAMMMGVRALQRGRTDMAIVGGASDCKAESLVLFSNAQTLTKDDSRPFDADADGLVISEGYVSLVMKTLDQALADGDNVQAVVRGLGVATDGRGKSLWAPLKDGQLRAMQQAYRSGVDPARLQYIECHATATQLGDATELESIGELLSPSFPDGKQIPLTSVKANIGHALEAAGIAGMIKTILCMQKKQFPPAININNLNPKINWNESPYFIPQQALPWQPPADGGPRLAGVNAFGIGGLNMHVTIEEFTEQSKSLIKQASEAPVESADDRAVAIIGMDSISAGARNITSLWELLLSGKDPKSGIPDDRWPSVFRDKTLAEGETVKGGFITDYEYDWRKHKVPPKQVKEADPLQFMFLDASEQALVNAGYDKETVNRERCGVVIGTEFGGDFSDQLEMGLRLPSIQHELEKCLTAKGYSSEQIDNLKEKYGDTLLKRWPALVDESGSFTSSTLASRISKTLNLRGGAVAIDSGPTAGLASLAVAVDALLSGDNDLMICGAGQRRMGPMMYNGLQGSGFLSQNELPLNLLDASYDGVTPGEGVGVVVLKRLADAIKDGDPIYSVIRGVGIANDESSATALKMAMRRASDSSGIPLSEVGVLNIDTDENAQDNVGVLESLFDAHCASDERSNALQVSSPTAQLGHAGGAASMFALLKTSLEVKNAKIAAPFNLQSPSQSMSNWSKKVQVANKCEKLEGRALGAVASWSKGQAIYVLLDDGKPVQKKQIKSIAGSANSNPESPRIIRLGESNLESLKSKLTASIGNVSELWNLSLQSQFKQTDQARMAIVADSPQSLSKKLSLALSQFNNPKSQQVLEQQGIFCREVLVNPPRVVGLFPGQGSQYQGMCEELVSQSPAAAKTLAEANQIMQELGYPTFAELAWSDTNQLGKDIWHTQISMLIADVICFAALKEQNVVPDLVLGHSYGEFAALYIAGAWDLKTAIQMTKARCDGISAISLKNAGLLATSAPVEDIKLLIAKVGCPAYLANYNAPDQTVVGGKREHLDQLMAALSEQSHPARLLAVPAAFHTPLMAGSSRMLDQALKNADLTAPTIPFISTVDNQLVNDPSKIRRNLGVQLTTPVRYAPLIEQLALETPTLFVEIGPQQTLTKLNRRILASGATVIAADNPKSAGLEQVLCVKALQECLGERNSTENTTTDSKVKTALPSGKTNSIFQPQTPSMSTNKTNKDISSMDDIPHFDATERRRAKMRTASDARPNVKNNNGHVSPVQQQLTTPVAPVMPAPVESIKPKIEIVPQPEVTPVVENTTSVAELETFLINFVVEQTGYPPEVVELDADLEADLGIDSIKKAQLFGELQEYFEINTSATELSLDDFPTLRHVLDFLANNAQATESSIAQPSAVISEPTMSQAPEAEVPLQVKPVAVEASPVVAGESSNTSVAELETFLINFVVEQTGYPPEVIELDADLEADLGIDSIKKAQLFGELQEYFEINTSATDLSLDDFPTLRHVLDFLAVNGQATSSSTVLEPVDPAPQVMQPVQPELPAEPSSQAVATQTTSSTSVAELETFLVNFVVEQTGYPAEVVELDADLEADLGIDSIKKAQLFGELQEYFEINTSATDLSLDDFPTLRHVLDFLATNAQATETNSEPPDIEPVSFSSAVPTPAQELNNKQLASDVNSHSSKQDAVTDTSINNVRVTETSCQSILKLSGSPYEQGWQQGKHYQQEICNLLKTYTSYIGESIDELPGSSNCIVAKEILSEDEYRELQGIADAVEVPLENILAHHFSTLEQLGVDADQVVNLESSTGTISHALSVGASIYGPLFELLDIQVLAKYPEQAISHLTVQGIGTTSILGGINSRGICVTGTQYSSTNQSTPRSVSSVLSEILRCADSLESAKAIVQLVGNVPAFKICISDQKAKQFSTLEFDGHSLKIHSDGKQDFQTEDESISFAIDSGSGQIQLKLPQARKHLNKTISYTEMFRENKQVEEPHLEQSKRAPLTPPGVTTRFEFEMRDAPLPEGVPVLPQWLGPAVILGKNKTTDVLTKKLQDDGVSVYQLDVSNESATLIAQIEQICANGPAPHFFITLPSINAANPSTFDDVWSTNHHDSLTKAFFVSQKWIELASENGWVDKCTLVSTANLGGDFGFKTGAQQPYGAGLSGLLKAIFIECTVMREGKGPRVKVIDHDSHGEANEIIQSIFTELASGNLDYEVGYCNNRRQIPFAVTKNIETPVANSSQPIGNWIVTGGARGITAECALELGKRYGVSLHLIGTTPLIEIDPSWRDLSEESLKQLKASTMIEAKKSGNSAPEAWAKLQKSIEIDKSIRQFAKAGIKATYHACDVSDRTALAEVLDKARQIDGPITGVLHGAGIDKSCRFEKKQPELVKKTIGTKADGAALLFDLTQQDPLKQFISFGSIAGRFGSFGQADYSVASDLVCKLMGAFRRLRPEVQFTGFHWHPWGEVGMAARPETQSILQTKSDLNLLPLSEGLGHFIREIESGLPCPEVMITEQKHWQRFAEGQGTLVESRKSDSTKSSHEVTDHQPKESAGHSELSENQDSEELVTQRCELRLLDSPLPSGIADSPVFDSPVWIYGDNPTAIELHRRLENNGAEVYRFSDVSDLDNTILQLEAIHPDRSSKYLFILSGSDLIADDPLSDEEINKRRHQGVIAPYFIAQKWYQRLLKEPASGIASLTATVALGGEFGFQGNVQLPEGGGVCGLLKSIHIEDTRRDSRLARCKAIDFAPADSPQTQVDAMFKELAASEPEVEVSWSNNRRKVVRPVPTDLPLTNISNIPRGGVWVITGGARGITSIAARELAKKYGWKLHLLGKSPAPQENAPWRNYNEAELKQLKVQMSRQSVAEGKSPAEAWDRVLKDIEVFNNINLFKEIGVSATYHSCDITDRSEVEQLLNKVREQDGAINGIMHGAGLIDPGRFEHKRRPFVEKLLRTKFDGLLHLLSLTSNDPLTHCIGFGSISGRFGGNGSSDYAAGNDSMSKVVGWLRANRPECTSICIHWESWEGSGMATLPRYAWGPKAVMKMKYMTPEEGVSRIEQELAAGGPNAEILYTFGDFHSMFYPDEQQPLGEFNSGISNDVTDSTLPLIKSSSKENQGLVANIELDPVADQFLALHRLRDKPLLPVVIMLEGLLEATELYSNKQVLSFRNVEMIEGMQFHNEKSTTAQARVSKVNDSLYESSLTCDFRNRSGGLIQKDRLYLKTQFEVGDQLPELAIEPVQIPNHWDEVNYPEEGIVYHGAPFRCLKDINCSPAGGWGKLTALKLADLVGEERAAKWKIPSCVLDSALYACGCQLWIHNEGAVSLPRLIEHLELGRSPRDGENCYVQFTCREVTVKSAIYDFTVIGENNDVIVRATGYHKVILTRMNKS